MSDDNQNNDNGPDKDVMERIHDELKRANDLREQEARDAEAKKKAEADLEAFYKGFPKYKDMLGFVDETINVKKDDTTQDMHMRLQELDKNLPQFVKSAAKSENFQILHATDQTYKQYQEIDKPLWEKYVVPVVSGPDAGSSIQIIKEQNPGGEPSIRANFGDGSNITHTLANNLVRVRQSFGETELSVPSKLPAREIQLNMYAAGVANGMDINPNHPYIPNKREQAEVARKIEELKKYNAQEQRLEADNMAELDGQVRNLKEILAPKPTTRKDQKLMEKIISADENSAEGLRERKEAIHIHGQLLSALGYREDDDGNIRYQGSNLSDSRKEKVQEALNELTRTMKEDGYIDNTQLRNALTYAGGDENTPSLTMQSIEKKLEARKENSVLRKVSRFFTKSNDDNSAPKPAEPDNKPQIRGPQARPALPKPGGPSGP
tara:strand:- start:2087 stop:3394 length:1308 start_codon:yes stop_codon:yes gene_type:complete